MASDSSKQSVDRDSPRAASGMNSVPRFAQQADFAAMVFGYRPKLKAIAAGLLPEQLRSRVDDSDLVQETLLKAVAQADRIHAASREELEAWLRETLTNSVRDCIRFHRRQQRSVTREQSDAVEALPSAETPASEQVRKAESRELVLKAVKALPEAYQTVILLRQQRDLTFSEIGDEMNRSPDAVRMLWGRAILALGEMLRSLNAQ
jgi:RNA polymerase sigma-70 factor (ECF subfamily)